jgi:Zn-dependent protease
MSLGLVTSEDAIRCACGTDIAPGVLACPGCHRLIHAAALKEHREQADAAARIGDTSAELGAWRLALPLVPPNSRQHVAISERIDALSEAALAAPDGHSPGWKWLGGLGTAGLIIWKLKFLVIALLTKGKLLLLGLTKASTVFSMLLSFGVYWTAWGMWFALGVVLSIYVHEMGHIAALRRFGIPATAPMFVPGLGAFIRLRAQRLSPREDARIGLAGPMWGLGAAGLAFAIGVAGGGPMWMAIARTGAWINAFNLLPVWQLDGNRGIAAIARNDRWLVAAAFVAGWTVAGDGLFVLLALTAVVRIFSQDAPESSDRAVLAKFGFLVLALAAIFRVSG